MPKSTEEIQMALRIWADRIPGNPERSAQVAARVSRRRRSRSVALTAGAVACAVLGVWTLADGSDQSASPVVSAPALAPVVGPPLPDEVTGKDGVRYRLVTQKSVDWPSPRELSFSIPFTGRPLAWIAECQGRPAGSAAAPSAGRAEGVRLAFLDPTRFTACGANDRTPRELPLSEVADPLHIWLEIMDGALIRQVTGPYGSSDGSSTARWTIGVYEQTSG